MQKNKLLQLLKTFTTEEMADFGRFLAFKKADNKCRLLWRIFSEVHPNYSHLPDKESLQQQVFSHKAHFTTELPVLFTTLWKLAKDFVVWQQFQADNDIRQKYLLMAFGSRKLNAFFEQAYRKFEQDDSRRNDRSVEFLYTNYERVNLLKGFVHVNPKSALAEKASDVGIARIFAQYALLVELQQYCSIVNISYMRQIEFNREYADSLTNRPIDGDGQTKQVITVYRQVLQLLLNPDDELYISLKLQLIDANCPLTDDERNFLLLIVQNHCSRQLAGGKNQYRAEMFALYQYRLDCGFLYKSGFLQPRDVKNIVTLAIQEGHFDWAKRFIGENEEKIAPFGRENTINSCMGSYYFHKKNYKKALKYLLQVDFNDFLYAIDNKNALLKIYYELNDEDNAIALIRTFRQYLKRHREIAPIRKKMYLNFMRIVLQLFKCRRREISAYKLREKITNCHPLSDRNWLLEKLATIRRK